MHTTELDALTAELATLEATHAALPIEELRARRSLAMMHAKAIADQAAEDLDPGTYELVNRATFDRAHSLVLAFDRVGY